VGSRPASPHFLNKIRILVFNAIFNNISAISWRPVIVVEEAGVPRENHRPWASNWQTLSLAAASVLEYKTLQVTII
jgi:hypothetical protein